MSATCWERTDIQFLSVKRLKGAVVMLLLALYRLSHILLTTSVSTGLSKYSGSVQLTHTVKSQEQQNNISLQTLYNSFICCKFEEKVSSYMLHATPSMI